MIRSRLAVSALCASAVWAGARAQTPAPVETPAFVLQAPHPASPVKPRLRKPATPASRRPAASDDAAERAARLAEGRRKFFENKAADEDKPVGDFGGYDYRRDSGTLSPRAGFKF